MSRLLRAQALPRTPGLGRWHVLLHSPAELRWRRSRAVYSCLTFSKRVFTTSLPPLLFCVSFFLSVGASFDAGDHAFVSYGPVSNDDLLQYYGFVERDNPSDAYVLEDMGSWLREVCVPYVRVYSPRISSRLAGYLDKGAAVLQLVRGVPASSNWLSLPAGGFNSPLSLGFGAP